MKFKFTRKLGGGYLNNKKITPKKSLVIGVLVGGIVFGSIGVAATTYFSASQISFTPTDEEWNVTNVEEATNSLYTDLKAGKEKLATAITNKGISTSSTDSFDTMSSNIGSITGSNSYTIPSLTAGNTPGSGVTTSSTGALYGTLNATIDTKGHNTITIGSWYMNNNNYTNTKYQLVVYGLDASGTKTTIETIISEYRTKGASGSDVVLEVSGYDSVQISGLLLREGNGPKWEIKLTDITVD